ncbi:MAG: hypothetical protein IJ055_01520 [Oscillospiraceae bacterium]|nr:hypothetical protein [Oscillospiraceae bacterium]
MYESKIRTALWWAYDIPGNIGWILYFAGFGRFLAKPGFLAHPAAGVLLALPALLMLIGILELVSERIRGLDRILPAVRFWRGFGALTGGGLLGAVLSAVTMYSNRSTANAILMLVGGVLCFVFAGLIALSFKKQK